MASTSGEKDDQGNYLDNEEIIIVSDQDSEDSGGMDEDSSDIIEFFEGVEITQVKSESLNKPYFCCCWAVDNMDAIKKVLNYVYEVQLNFNNIQCVIDNIIRCYNCLLNIRPEPLNPDRLFFADYFYRIRHELLFQMVLKTLNIPDVKSDVPFNRFGINSNRTPDLIIRHPETSELIIVEVSVTSNYDKAAQIKGVDASGFESKYEKEITELKKIGEEVCYFVIIFDVSERVDTLDTIFQSLSDKFIINKNYFSLLKVVFHDFSILTNNLKGFNVLPATILFSNLIEIPRDHESLKFLYNDNYNPNVDRHTYKELKVSHSVYKRIATIWHRIPSILDNLEYDNKLKYLPVLNINNGRIRLKESLDGLTTAHIVKLIVDCNTEMFFKKLLLDTGTATVKATDSKSGYRIIDRMSNSSVIRSPKPDEFISCGVDHNADELIISDPDFSSDYLNYRKKIDILLSHNYNSIHKDLGYEDTILEAYYGNDSLPNNCDTNNNDYRIGDVDLLSNNELNLIRIEDIMAEQRNDYIKINSLDDGLPIKSFKVKQPFLMPLSEINSLSYSPISEKRVPFIESVISNLGLSNMFTAEVLRKTLQPEYEFHSIRKPPSEALLELMNEKRKMSMELSKAYRQKIKDIEINQRKDFKIKDTAEGLTIAKQISKLDKIINKRIKEEGVKEEISLIRLPSKNRNTVVGGWFKNEMSHFKDKSKQSTIEGVGLNGGFDCMLNSTTQTVENLLTHLPVFAGENPDEVICDTRQCDDVSLLKDLKNEAFNMYLPLVNNIKNSYLGHAAALVSRLCHSLLFYSQMSFNAEKVRVDNLGYNEVLLIVRGGNKIFKSKSSKLFRLVYPISEYLVGWYCGKGSSFSTFEYLGNHYLITPWQLMHESILSDGLSFYNRVVSFCVLNSKPNVLFSDQFKRLSINVLLAFHNRRQTEVFLANLRYVLLSCLGDYSGFTIILKDFLGFNYDFFQAFLRCTFIENFPKYFNTLRQNITKISMKKRVLSEPVFAKGLTNLFVGSEIQNQDDLALMIYSTFLMTKAPYKRNVERASNLLSILKIHENYNETVGLHLNPEEQLNKINVNLSKGGNLNDYAKNLFNNDFSIDSKYLANLGMFADSLFENKGVVDDLTVKWIQIISESWDLMATSTGLRGDLEDVEDFWGKKGYFVVYKELIKKPSFLFEVKELFEVSLSEDRKRQRLKILNESYLQEIKDPAKFWIFHAVDKTQWRGGREIYVMDIHTKKHQQPIEKFMGFLCKQLDNELISIPSDKRSQVIHHSIFEKDIDLQEGLTWYLTLDCTKWAPKSVFVKFAIMLLNMTTIPPSFKTHFLNYLDKLYLKRVYFNSSEVDVLKNNPLYSQKVGEHLVFDPTVKGYYLLMPYSWVMGIFNYTSSFLHAVNQDYASYLISKSSMAFYKEDTQLYMFAHSDDSGGRITASHKKLIKRGIALYELNLKACNHLLSKKKSVVARYYFEVLSIIYIFHQLLALLPKFLGGIRFLPTDKGPAQDMSQAYSKCIEVMVAGADFSVAHIVMCFYTCLVWRFYYNRKPTQNDFRRPAQLLGIPSAHPLMVLLAGSDSDIVRLLSSGQRVQLKALLKLSELLKPNLLEDSLVQGFKFQIKVRGVQKGFEESISEFSDQINNWSLRYVNFKSTPFNFLNFLSKLNDPGFVGSLVNESVVRRLSRSYFLRTGNSVETSAGLLKLAEVMAALELVQDMISKGSNLDYGELLGDPSLQIEQDINDEVVEEKIRVMETVLSGPLKINKYMMGLRYNGARFVKRTLKPTHLQIIKTGRGFSTKFDPAILVSYMTDNSLRWALPDVRNLDFLVKELDKICELFSLDKTLLNQNYLLQICRYFSDKSKKDIYLYSRVPSDLRQVKTYSAFLSFLSVNSFDGQEINGLVLKLDKEIVGADYLNKEIDEEIYISATIIGLLTSLTRVTSGSFVSKITLNNIPELEWGGGSVLDLCQVIINRSLIDHGQIVNLLPVAFLKKYIEGTYIDSSIIIDSFFYTFTKRQKTRSGWYGKGALTIYCAKSLYSFEMNNNDLVTLETNVTGKIDTIHLAYILDVLNSCGAPLNNKYMISSRSINTSYVFGYDWAGDLSIMKPNEMRCGIPVKLSFGKPGFLNNIGLYDLNFLEKNKYLLIPIQNEIMNKSRSYKIYTLSSNQSFLLPLVRKVFNHRDFENKLLEGGFGNLEEFIYNEILMDYGVESSVKLETFADNYASSRLYEVMREVKIKSLSKIPNKLQTSFFPAPDGGLLRALYSYSEENPEKKVIKLQKNISYEYMAIRNLYPEQFLAVLSENANENYTKLFTPSERSEILQAYLSISNYKTVEELQSNLIKTMSYWGFSSLTSTLQLYTFTKTMDNIKAVKWEGNKLNKQYFANLFITVIKGIIETMLEMRFLIYQMDFNLEQFKPTCDFELFTHQYAMKLAIASYDFKYTGKQVMLHQIIFNNYLIGFLMDPDFCVNLSSKFSNQPYLSTIPIDYQNRVPFLAFYNNLMSYWLLHNANHVTVLDFTVRVQRFGDGVRDPVSLYKDLHPNPKATTMKFYHGQVNRNLLQFMSRPVKLKGKKIYNVKSEIGVISEQKVPIMSDFRFIRNLKDDLMENPDWQDFVYESEMADVDIETMREILDNIKQENGSVYMKSTNLFDNDKIYIRVKWILVFSQIGSKDFIDNLRQVGENIIILTDIWSPYLVNNAYNTKVRRVNFSIEYPEENYPNIDYFVYTMLSDERLDDDFIKSYIGGEKINLNPNLPDVVHTRTYINFDESIGELKTEFDSQLSLFKNQEEIEKIEEENRIKLENEEEEKKKRRSLLSAKGLLRSTLNEAVKDGKISKETSQILFGKYSQAIKDKNITNLENIVKDLFAEIDLNNLVNIAPNLLKGNLTPEENVKILQAPSHFGLSYEHNKINRKRMLSDKKIHIELSSLHEKLPNYISSGTLTMDSQTAKAVYRSFSLWRTAVKGTKHKKENKEFLLTILNMAINDSDTAVGGTEKSMEHSVFWRELIENCSNYFGDEGEFDDHEEMLGFFGAVPGSRLKYTPYQSYGRLD